MKHLLSALLLCPLMAIAGPSYLLTCEECESPVARLELRNYTPGDTMYRYNFQSLDVFGHFVLDESVPDLEYGNANNGIFGSQPASYYFELSGTVNQTGAYFSSALDGSWAYGFTADCPPVLIEGPSCVFNPHTNPGSGTWILEQPVPEPSTLFLVALAGFLALVRKRDPQ